VNKELNSTSNRSIVTSDIKWIAESNRKFAAWIGKEIFVEWIIMNKKVVRCLDH